MAQMPFSPCDATGPCTDVSVGLLQRVFGNVIQALVTGADPGTALANGNLLATMFSFFNSGILVIGSLIVSYVAVMGAINTANDGEAMGKQWSSLWTPVRIVAGGGALLPTASGYSFIQLVVMLFALWGIGFANGTYRLGMAMGVLSPNGIVRGVNQPGAYYGLRDFGKQYIAAAYCARVANAIYSDASGSGIDPQVRAANTQDKSITTDGRTEYSFFIKDRNAATNLAGGEPFCGTVNIARYSAQPMSDATAMALESLRAAVQGIKVDAVGNMMTDLEAWVSTWPADINQAGWDAVDSNEFNNIVNGYEGAIANDLVQSVNNNQPGVDASLDVFLTSITADGWAAAGGWFQKVGMLRGQISNVISEPVGSVSGPSYTALPTDSRVTLLMNSVTTAIETVTKKAEQKASYSVSGTAKPEDLASLIPKDATGDLNAGAIAADMNAKMSSFVNRSMLNIVEIATGANGTGTTLLCGTAGAMGGSLNRMKCIGDYLVVAQEGLFIADVGIKTATTALRVVAGTVSAVPVIGPGLDKVSTPLWDWMLEVPIKQIAVLLSYIEPMAFYFSVFLPSLPYTIFMIVVVGWLLAVFQYVVAVMFWAVMHTTPDKTFIGSQSQGYLLLLSLFARPALAVVGLFAAVLVSDPIIDYIAKGFFAMRGAVVSSTGGVGAIAEFMTFAWWIMIFGLTLLPVLYMCFGLPQILPDHVLRWIGAGVADLGETNAIGHMRSGMASSGIGTGRTLGSSPRARLGGGNPNSLPPGGGASPNGGSGSSYGGDTARRSGPIRSSQILSANPQGVSPQTSNEGPVTSDARRLRDKVGEGAGVSLGRAITDGSAASARTAARFGNSALSAGSVGVTAFRETSGSMGKRLGAGLIGLGSAGLTGLASASQSSAADFGQAARTTLSEGKAAFTEGADARIEAFKAGLRGSEANNGSGTGIEPTNPNYPPSSEVLSGGAQLSPIETDGSYVAQDTNNIDNMDQGALMNGGVQEVPQGAIEDVPPNGAER